MSHIDTPIFPTDISLASVAVPMYNNEAVQLNGGAMQVNSIWTYPLHRFEIGYGIKTDTDMEEVREYFHAVGGMANTFNYMDHNDHLSCDPRGTISNLDQTMYFSDDLDTYLGDGAQTTFQTVKSYTKGSLTQKRIVRKLWPTYFTLAVDGVAKTEGVDYTVSDTTGIATLSVAPTLNQVVTCGFKSYVAVRFMDNELAVSRIEPGIETAPQITLMEDRDA